MFSHFPVKTLTYISYNTTHERKIIMVPTNFNRYGYIKYIAACDCFLALVEPLKSFIASNDGKKLTARIVSGFTRIHPRIAAYYFPKDWNPRFYAVLDTQGLEGECPEIPRGVPANDCGFFQFLSITIHKDQSGCWAKDRKHVYLIGGHIIADGWIAAIEDAEAYVKKEKEECRKILAAMNQMTAAC